MTGLETANLFLDVVIKSLALLLGVYLLYLLRNLNKFVLNAEESVKKVEESAEAVEKSVRWGKILPWIGGSNE